MKNIAAALIFLALLLTLGGSSFAADGAVRISYVKAPFNLQLMVMKERGLLEKALAPLGVTASWEELVSGPVQNQAMASGRLDLAGVMNSTSILLAASEGAPLKIIAGAARPADLFALAVRPEEAGGPANFSALKGKTIAGPKGTILHQLLAAGLAREGLGMDAVNFVHMELPQAFAALSGGSVDAALLVGGMIIKAQENGLRILSTASGLVSPILAMVASERFVKEHPDRLEALNAAYAEAWTWMRENPEEAMELGAGTMNISLDEAGQLFAWSNFTPYFDEQDQTNLRRDARFLQEAGLMRHAIDTDALFLSQALK